MAALTSVFGGLSSEEPIILNPHSGFTSGGQLPKGWDLAEEYLYKAEMEPQKTYCIYSEAICSDLADLLEIEHVKYEIGTVPVITSVDKLPVLTEVVRCHTYLTSQTSALTLYDLIQAGMSLEEAREYLCSVNTKLYCQMLLFDFLVANTDRHFRNLGILNGPSGTKMIPLFDHDRALYSQRQNDTGMPFNVVDGWATERLYQGTMRYLMHHAASVMNPLELKNLCDWERLYNVGNLLAKYTALPVKRRESLQLMLQLRTDYMLKELDSL